MPDIPTFSRLVSRAPQHLKLRTYFCANPKADTRIEIDDTRVVVGRDQSVSQLEKMMLTKQGAEKRFHQSLDNLDPDEVYYRRPHLYVQAVHRLGSTVHIGSLIFLAWIT